MSFRLYRQSALCTGCNAACNCHHVPEVLGDGDEGGDGEHAGDGDSPGAGTS